MSIIWSNQQLAIFDEFINPTSQILAIEAVARSCQVKFTRRSHRSL